MSALPLIYAPSPRRHMLSPSYCTTYPVNNYSWKEIRPSADQHLTTHRHCQPLARRIHVINVSGCSHSAPFITFLECTSSHRPIVTGPVPGETATRSVCRLDRKAVHRPTINTLAHVIPIDSLTTNVSACNELIRRKP